MQEPKDVLREKAVEKHHRSILFMLKGSCIPSRLRSFEAGFDAGYAARDGEECVWCKDGDARVPSSVSDAWVHPATSVGRIVCRRVESPAEDALRSLAAFVGSGGYNAPTVDAKEFEAKIRDGIDTLVRVEVERAVTADRRERLGPTDNAPGPPTTDKVEEKR